MPGRLQSRKKARYPESTGPGHCRAVAQSSRNSFSRLVAPRTSFSLDLATPRASARETRAASVARPSSGGSLTLIAIRSPTRSTPGQRAFGVTRTGKIAPSRARSDRSFMTPALHKPFARHKASVWLAATGYQIPAGFPVSGRRVPVRQTEGGPRCIVDPGNASAKGRIRDAGRWQARGRSGPGP